VTAPVWRLPAAQSRLLLVDDEPRLLGSLYELLGERDYHLTTAASGAEAIAQLRLQKFDLILLDLRMPDIGGHGVMDFINDNGIDVTFIAMSGDTDIDSAIGALKRGAYDYLRKPYTREELYKTVDNALRERRLEHEHSRIAGQLERSEHLYRSLVDSSPDIIYTLNHEGRFTFVNDRVQQLLGYRREDLIGRHFSFVVHDEDMQRAEYVFSHNRLHQRAGHQVELRFKTSEAGGEPRVFANTLTALPVPGEPLVRDFDADNEPIGTYGVARDVTDSKRADELISHQAYHDILTDLPNRVLFKDRLGLAMLQARRNKTQLAVLFIDLDRFKLVNDTLGHPVGDELLRQAAGRLKACLRRGDTLARLGGDEFTLVLPEVRPADVETIAQKCLACLQQAFQLGGNEVHISASIGSATYPADGETLDELVRHADIAMYQVKARGKNGHAFYHPAMDDETHQRVVVEQSLRKALELGELEMYYQPQVDVRSGRITGAEGLMRWHHPERGLLTAGEFLPFADENGLMLPLSDWMLDVVCRDLAAWNAAGHDAIKLSLNVSPEYLDRGDFFEKMRDALVRHAVPSSQIEVEITENICITNPQHAIEQLEKLCQLGLAVAIDDFGTGYSSLSYLHRFPVHTIKIDQSFVKAIQDENGHFPVVLAIISIARGLGLNLVAEGVETETQARYLEQSGCRTMQGYLYHRPVPQSRLLELLGQQSTASVADDFAFEQPYHSLM
jgi:diguanylate cyclase (GGDEF)-like protein/PAS domain S-box-containing protein